MDIYSKRKRSEIMRAVRNRDSKMEIAFRKELSKLRLRYRTNVSSLPSSPDIAFVRHKLAVFLDSCFWHGCKWHGSMPSTNKQFWAKKIAANRNRDKKVKLRYKKMGWKVIRVWEHELKRDSREAADKIIGILRLDKYGEKV